MLDAPIAPNATLLTIQDGLDHPIEYVRRVLEHAWPIGGNAIIRIAVGAGESAPDYLVEEVLELEGTVVPVAAYSGKTHRPIAGPATLDDGYWSIASLTRKDLTELLGKLRSFKPKSKGPPHAKRS
jgi:hypothetical protein